MSQTDSFVEEVSDELRRDRMFAAFRRWGPLVLIVLVLIVGASAWNEWRKHQETTAREAAGDAMRLALSAETPEARLAALQALAGPDWPAPVPLALALAGAQAQTGAADAAEATLRGLIDDAAVDTIYRDAARMRLLALKPGMAPQDRLALIEPMIGPDAPFRLLALEQRAVAHIEAADTDKAAADLQAILADPLATGDLRFRAEELLTAIGGTPAAN